MRRPLPSASNLARVVACRGSEALPHIPVMTEAGANGTAIHAFIACAHSIGREAALVEMDADAPYYQLCAALPVGELPAGGSHEVAIAWDHVTDIGRAIVGNGHRDYSSVGPTEYVGTADYVGADRETNTIVVIDWKSGYRYLGPARDSWQLRMLALAAVRAAQADNARVAYCFLRDDGSYAYSWGYFDPLDLATIADELRDLAARLGRQTESMSLAFYEGPHCDYCPAFHACPAKMRLARAIGNGEAMTELATIEQRIESMSDAELARAYQAIERYDDIAERVRRALRQRAAMQPIDLGDGRKLGTVPWPFTSVRADIAHATLTEMHGVEVADRACPRKTTIAAIRAIGPKTLAEIERRRGVIVGSKPQVRVHRP